MQTKPVLAQRGEWRRRHEQSFVGARRTKMVPEPSGGSSEALFHLGIERSMKSYKSSKGKIVLNREICYRVHT